MTVLSRSERNPLMMTVQCDLCSLPLIITNTEPVIAALGWQLAARGADCDACPSCRESRDGRTPLSLRRHGFAQGDLDGRLPDLLVIGAAKSGTTSLHCYLGAHPDVYMAAWKELRFFTDPDYLIWEQTYRQLFASSAKIVGESSTMYTRAPALPGVPERMAALVPYARLIYLVRDPVERAVASYVEERFHGLEARGVEEAFADLDDPYNPYVSASRYAEQLELFLAYFPRDQVLVLTADELGRDPGATLGRAFEFLDVDPDAPVDVTRRHNDRTAKVEYVEPAARLRRGWPGRAVRRLHPRMRHAVTRPARRLLTRPITAELSAGTLGRLREVLAPDARRFRALTGLELPDWSV